MLANVHQEKLYVVENNRQFLNDDNFLHNFFRHNLYLTTIVNCSVLTSPIKRCLSNFSRDILRAHLSQTNQHLPMDIHILKKLYLLRALVNLFASLNNSSKERILYFLMKHKYLIY